VDTILEHIQQIANVELSQLQPLTTLLVWTWDSLYEMTVREGSEVLVQGGSFFPKPTPACVRGASTTGIPATGWIGVGLSMEFRVEGKRIVTSPVVAIATEAPGISVVQ
jgi:hypothetical protein